MKTQTVSSLPTLSTDFVPHASARGGETYSSVLARLRTPAQVARSAQLEAEIAEILAQRAAAAAGVK